MVAIGLPLWGFDSICFKDEYSTVYTTDSVHYNSKSTVAFTALQYYHLVTGTKQYHRMQRAKTLGYQS